MPMSSLVKLHHLNEEQQAIVDIIGIDNYRALMDVYGGDRIWIPKPRSLLTAAEISFAVRSKHQNGYTPEQIARELELSIADVRKMLK